MSVIRKRKDGSHTCFYEDIPNTRCSGKLAFIVHDKRGCHLTCQGHAKWRGETSTITGHGPDCPGRFDVYWKQVTVV